MKYGILGDIHANLEALEAVLDEMGKQGVEKHVSVGDLVGYGANPIECIDLDSGTLIWQRALPNMQRLISANSTRNAKSPLRGRSPRI